MGPRRCQTLLPLALALIALHGASGVRPVGMHERLASKQHDDAEVAVGIIRAQDGGLSALPSAAGNADAVAVARFVPARARKSDFAQLRINTNGGFADAVQMRAAGFAEGFVTAGMISDHWHNMQWWLAGSTNQTDRLLSWLWDQDRWTRKQLEDSRGKGDTFMDALGLLMEQFDGLVEGYAARVRQSAQEGGEGNGPKLAPIDNLGFLLLNAFGDIDDLLEMLESDQLGAPLHEGEEAGRKLSPKWDRLNPTQARAHIAQRGHCSALIKVTPDLSDILISHNTWWSFSSMLRIYKHYTFTSLSHPSLKSKATSFSSYPGALSSIDDWYILDSQMVITETSNNVYDTTLYRLATNKAALSWHRARVANMLAEDGSSWATYVAMHNSGTYNNQYLVVDLKRFQPYGELQPGLLTVVETLPGLVVSGDKTADLERGYWPSYNIPVFNEVYSRMGYDLLRNQLAEKDGFDRVQEDLSYQLAPRAKIFRRDAGSVTNLDSLKRVTRSNGWPQGDTLSSTPWNAISARGDLSPDPDSRSAYGAYDAKATNYRLALKLTAEAVNGPTWGADLPPFSWADWPHIAHKGMREVFDTEWEVQSP